MTQVLKLSVKNLKIIMLTMLIEKVDKVKRRCKKKRKYITVTEMKNDF